MALTENQARELIQKLYQQYGYNAYLGDRFYFLITFDDWTSLRRYLCTQFNILASNFSPILHVEGMLFIPLPGAVQGAPEVVDREVLFKRIQEQVVY